MPFLSRTHFSEIRNRPFSLTINSALESARLWKKSAKVDLTRLFALWERDPGVDPGVPYSFWNGNAYRSPNIWKQGSVWIWKVSLGMSELFSWTCCHHDPTLNNGVETYVKKAAKSSRNKVGEHNITYCLLLGTKQHNNPFFWKGNWH